METQRFRSGWVTFAGVIAAIVAVWNILSGIAAIAKDDQTEAINEVLFGVNITAWGWFWLIIGVVQLVTAYLIFVRHPMGQILGVLWAAISASLAVFMIFVAPIWGTGGVGDRRDDHLGPAGSERRVRHRLSAA